MASFASSLVFLPLLLHGSKCILYFIFLSVYKRKLFFKILEETRRYCNKLKTPGKFIIISNIDPWQILPCWRKHASRQRKFPLIIRPDGRRNFKVVFQKARYHTTLSAFEKPIRDLERRGVHKRFIGDQVPVDFSTHKIIPF